MRKLLILLLLGVVVYYVYYHFFSSYTQPDAVDKLRANYEAEIEQICQEKALPSAYFKALVILESSAEKPAAQRFESHVFDKLQEVQAGKRARYGKFTTQQMQLLSENTIRKLATSWGPLQLMGYHCIPMGISFDQLTGPEALSHAIDWVDRTYGQYLRAGDYENAFHIHNTGRPIPVTGETQTYDPDYIVKGMEYIAYFEENS